MENNKTDDKTLHSTVTEIVETVFQNKSKAEKAGNKLKGLLPEAKSPYKPSGTIKISTILYLSLTSALK